MNDLLKEFYQERGLHSRRLVSAESMKLKKIVIHISEGQVKVVECPKDVKKVYLYRRAVDGIWKAYAGDYPGASELDTWHILEDVSPGKIYEVGGETNETVTLYNSGISEAYYQSRDDDMLECYVCSNDEVIFRRVNLEAKSLGFRSCIEWEHCLEVVLDPDPSEVDFYCNMKDDCLVVKNSLLARTLTSEGNIEAMSSHGSSGEKFYVMVPYTGAGKVLHNRFVELGMGNILYNIKFLKGE